MSALGEAAARHQRVMTPLAIAIVVVLLAGLPLAAWLDLRNLSEQILRRQAEDIGRALDDVRDLYANEVVGPIVAAREQPITVTHKYRGVTGGIPIPATFSIELGRRISARERQLVYRFVSDLAFLNRDSHRLDAFETNALASLRAAPANAVVEAAGSVLDRAVRVATPVIMSSPCVDCHATHPDSPKRDWKVGDVRGIQAITVRQSIDANIFAFKYLLIYFAMAAALGTFFILMQSRQAAFIRGMNAELAEASRHKSQFLANMSHELRTPLNAILGYTELILDNLYGDVSDKIREVLQRLERSGKHLLSLINEVLDLSKIEAGQLTLSLTNYAMEDVVHGVCRVVEPLAAEKRIAVKVTLPDELPRGRGDERRIMQVLLNLVGNAVKFTDQGEVVVIASATDGSFNVSVRDTGPGISEADQAKLFQEFQQADNPLTRKKGGTGLGLAISKRIIEMHGGRIRVESRLGEGTTFSFSLPVVVQPPAQAG